MLHDLRLEHEGLSVQIDYLIITTKFCLIVECKNLFGNLEVNSRGEFIRELAFNGHRKKEGIYSPITQNVRHAEGIKAFYVYNNLQLEALIAAMPRNVDELRKISGFGEVKCEKYGDGILKIVDRYRDAGR